MPIQRAQTLGERVDSSIHSIDNSWVLGLVSGFSFLVLVDVYLAAKRRKVAVSSLPLYVAYAASLALAGYQHYFAPKITSPIGLMRHLSENVLGEGAAWY